MSEFELGLFCIAGIISIIVYIVFYFLLHKIVLKMYSAEEASEKDFPEFHKILKEVSGLAKIPKPKGYIIESDIPNIFATGRNPKHSIIGVTYGMAELLSEKEFRGVIAHEMAHIKNRDTLIQIITASVVGVFAFVAMAVRWKTLYDEMSGNGGQILNFIILTVVTPLIVIIIQLAITRKREYLADEVGAKIIHDPYSLTSALRKLNNGYESFSRLFSTHPSVDERIERLLEMRL